MNLIKKEWLQLLILLVPFCAVALLWDKLPDQVPIHWNARGEADNYAGRTFGSLLVPKPCVPRVLNDRRILQTSARSNGRCSSFTAMDVEANLLVVVLWHRV